MAKQGNILLFRERDLVTIVLERHVFRLSQTISKKYKINANVNTYIINGSGKCLTWQVKNKMAVEVWSEITKCISIHIHPAVDSSRFEDS